MLQQPYLSADAVTCDTVTPQSTSGVNAGVAAMLARVEVQPGKSVFYEINPPNRSAVPTANSPMITGDQVFPFGPGWKFSFLEAVIS